MESVAPLPRITPSSAMVASLALHAGAFALLGTLGAATLSKLSPPPGPRQIVVALVQRVAPARPAPPSLRQSTSVAPSHSAAVTRSVPAVASAPDSVQDRLQTSQAAASTADPSELSRYLYGLRDRIDRRKIYPSLSRRMGETGKVVIALEVQADGSLSSVAIRSASAHARLDQAALEAVTGLGKYEPIPQTLSQTRLAVEVPIEFTL